MVLRAPRAVSFAVIAIAAACQGGDAAPPAGDVPPATPAIDTCEVDLSDDAAALFAAPPDGITVRGFAYGSDLEPVSDGPNRYAGEPAPSGPGCVPFHVMPEASPSLRHRLEVVFVVPSDLAGEAAPERIAPHARRVTDLVASVQEQLRAAMGGEKSFSFGHPSVVTATHPRDWFWCAGTEGCSRERFADRVAQELDAHGHRVASPSTATLAIVLGGGPVASAYRPINAPGGLAVVGDALLEALESACGAATPCSHPAGARAVAHLVGHTLGLPESGGGGLMDTARLTPLAGGGAASPDAITLTAAERERLAGSPLVAAGLMTGGVVRLSTARDEVHDLAIGAGSLLAVWERPLGACREVPGGGCRYYAAIAARLVRLDGTLGPEIQLSAPPAENPSSLGDRQAAVAYDTARDAFQVVWYRYHSDTAQIGLYTRRVDALTGQPAGPERRIGATAAFGEAKPAIDYSRTSDRFLVALARYTDTINDRGAPLETVWISGDGSQNGQLQSIEIDAKYPALAWDPTRDRFLLAYTHYAAGSLIGNSLRGLFVDAAGAAQGSSFELRPRGDVMWPKVAYDTMNDRFLLTAWESANAGPDTGVYNWDATAGMVAATSGVLTGYRRFARAAGYQYFPDLSVMNYGRCNRHVDGHISQLDVGGSQALYGVCENWRTEPMHRPPIGADGQPVAPFDYDGSGAVERRHLGVFAGGEACSCGWEAAEPDCGAWGAWLCGGGAGCSSSRVDQRQECR